MRRTIALSICIGLVSTSVIASSAPLTDAEIRKILIRQSIANYPGKCACPYNLMKNGRACGKWSAYSKPGGYEPLCYPDDVSDEVVKDFRKQLQD